jgi:hypothetical protein
MDSVAFVIAGRNSGQLRSRAEAEKTQQIVAPVSLQLYEK